MLKIHISKLFRLIVLTRFRPRSEHVIFDNIKYLFVCRIVRRNERQYDSSLALGIDIAFWILALMTSVGYFLFICV